MSHLFRGGTLLIQEMEVDPNAGVCRTCFVPENSMIALTWKVMLQNKLLLYNPKMLYMRYTATGNWDDGSKYE